MKRYYIREGSPLDTIIKVLATIGVIILLNLPSTIENLMGWL